MGFQFWPAILAGLIAGAIMEGPVYLQKALGLDVKQDIFRTWGTLLRRHGAGAYAAGVLFHQVLAAGSLPTPSKNRGLPATKPAGPGSPDERDGRSVTRLRGWDRTGRWSSGRAAHPAI